MHGLCNWNLHDYYGRAIALELFSLCGWKIRYDDGQYDMLRVRDGHIRMAHWRDSHDKLFGLRRGPIRLDDRQLCMHGMRGGDVRHDDWLVGVN